MEKEDGTILNPQCDKPVASELAQKLGRRLRFLRSQASKTQDQLSQGSGVSRAYICKIEAGRITPRYLTLARLAACLGVETAELVRGDLARRCDALQNSNRVNVHQR